MIAVGPSPPILASTAYPALLQALAAAHGHRATIDPADCDIALLGPGNEDHAAWLAAANPGCRVWLLGEDHDAEVIATWQQDAQLANLALVENARSELAHLVLPEFAIVLVQDLAGQLEDAALAALLDWCAGALQPGGLGWFAYDSLPGATALDSLRDIAQAIAAGTDDMGQWDNSALAYFDELDDAGAPLLTEDSVASRVYRRLLALAPSERHRSLFAPDFQPRHMTELAGHCEAAGLRFAGACGRMTEQEDALTAAALLERTDAGADTLSLEQHLCFAMNEARRADLYVRPAEAVPRPASPLCWLGADGARHEFAVDTDWPALERAVAVDGHLPAYGTPPVPGPARRHNTLALHRAIVDERPEVTLAAARVGCGVTVPTEDALWLLARSQAGEDTAPAWAAAEIDRLGKTLVATDSQADIEVILAEAFHDSATRLPAYVRLGLEEW